MVAKISVGKSLYVNLTLEVYADCEPQPAPVHFDYPSVAGRTEVVIVGSGPAMFYCRAGQKNGNLYVHIYRW